MRRRPSRTSRVKRPACQTYAICRLGTSANASLHSALVSPETLPEPTGGENSALHSPWTAVIVSENGVTRFGTLHPILHWFSAAQAVARGGAHHRGPRRIASSASLIMIARLSRRSWVARFNWIVYKTPFHFHSMAGGEHEPPQDVALQRPFAVLPICTASGKENSLPFLARNVPRKQASARSQSGSDSSRTA